MKKIILILAFLLVSSVSASHSGCSYSYYGDYGTSYCSGQPYRVYDAPERNWWDYFSTWRSSDDSMQNYYNSLDRYYDYYRRIDYYPAYDGYDSRYIDYEDFRDYESRHYRSSWQVDYR